MKKRKQNLQYLLWAILFFAIALLILCFDPMEARFRYMGATGSCVIGVIFVTGFFEAKNK